MNPCHSMYIPREQLMSSCYYMNDIRGFSPESLKAVNAGVPIKKTSDQWYQLYSNYNNVVIKKPTGFLTNNGGDAAKFWYLQPIYFEEFVARIKASSLIKRTASNAFNKVF